MSMQNYGNPPSRNAIRAASVKPGKVAEQTVGKPSTPAPTKGNGGFASGRVINGKC